MMTAAASCSGWKRWGDAILCSENEWALASRTTGDIDLRALDWHRGAAVTALTLAL
jgi:hypothetical protein